MLNKSIQPVDLTNILSSTPQSAASGGNGEGDGARFSQLLSGQESTQPGNKPGKLSPVTGNNLPDQDTPGDGEAKTVATTPPIIENIFDPQMPASLLPTAEQPGVLATDTPVQTQTQIRETVSGIPDALPLTTLTSNETAEQVLAAGDVSMPHSNEVSVPPVEQAIEQAVRTVIPHSPVSDRVADTPLQSPPQVDGPAAPPSVELAMLLPRPASQLPGQVFNATVLAAASQQVDTNSTGMQTSAQSAEQVPLTAAQTNILPDPAEAQTREAMDPAKGQQALLVDPAAARIISQAVSIEAAPAATDITGKHFVTDSGQVRAAVNVLPTTESGRPPSGLEPASNLMGDAIRMAVASQADSGDLKQSLQGQKNLLQGSDMTAALSRTETSNPLAFIQTLSGNSPLTMPSARVEVPVGQQGWSNAVGQQVNWFISQDVSAANLRLNPQHLGPVEMQISMDGDKANISFLSQHSIVREALESSLPRLREMLAESGLQLVNVNISQHGASDQQARNREVFQQGADPSRAQSDNDSGTIEMDGFIQQGPAATIGLIDAYA